ncbi:hypothetical protein HNV12_02135 [Methanococcoides sp. SA1]|nr:hypothetical protein [Methanococcoides sp. SA1]
MNKGDYYFVYNGSYDRNRVRQAVLDLGYVEEFKGGPLSTPQYVKGENIVNFTSWKEGKMQIKLYVGDVKENLFELMDALEPDCLVNTAGLEVEM